MDRLTRRSTLDGEGCIFVKNDYGGGTYYMPYDEPYQALERLALYEDAAEAAIKPKKETGERKE